MTARPIETPGERPGSRIVRHLGPVDADDGLPKGAPIRHAAAAAAPAHAPAEVPRNTTEQEEAMPKGVYKRKKKGEGDAASAAPAQPAQKPAKRRGGRRRSAQGSGAMFGVFDDGTVHITAEKCAGVLTGDEAKLFWEFVDRLRKGGWLDGKQKKAPSPC